MKDLPPDPDGVNARRSERAGDALALYARVTGLDKATKNLALTLEDLLTDLIHWCDRNEVDFDAVAESAAENYKGETTDGSV